MSIILDPQTLKIICLKVQNEFNHSEWEMLLQEQGFSNICPKNSLARHKRIYNTFVYYIEKSNSCTKVFNTLFEVINPVRFEDQDEYNQLVYELNSILLHKGIKLTYESGKKQLHKVKPAKNISDSQARANFLIHIIKDRNLHPKMLDFCKEEYLQENYFHAVFEASKSIMQSIRDKTGLTDDGNTLIQKAFNITSPYLAFTSLETDSQKSEQKGFSNLLCGICSMFRNPTAHEPKITYHINKEDAIDIFTIISFAHRKLDTLHLIKRNS